MTLLYAKILQQAGYDCRLLIVKNHSDIFNLKPFIPLELPYELIQCRYRYLYYHIIRHLVQSKPDCVFNTPPFLVPALVFSKMINPRMKVVFRDCNMPTTHPAKQSYPVKFILRFADAVIAQTEEMKQEMALFYHVNPNRITVIGNPLDKQLIQSKIQETYCYPSPQSTHYVAVARIAPQKDYITLIKAFAIVLKHDKTSRLEIIGNRPDYYKYYVDRVDKLIDELGIRNSVTFHGFQENPYKFMEAADVFVLSSTYEGMPNVMLEAMYLGKPVVVTRSIPYISQVVHDGINGYTVPVGDYEKLANAMIKARRLNVKKFVDINSSEKQITELFGKVFNPLRK